MFTIYKLQANPVVDFAAEELKKYLLMMDLACTGINICYDPDAKDGFRLGLLQDFGIPFEGKDLRTDDVVHIDTDEKGGILAGSNYRSILFAVYRFLKLNGCRFFAPGPDGEYIPRKSIEPQKYHKLADHVLRGHTIEGRPSCENVLDYIDYHAKQELNTFSTMMAYSYMSRYYNHDQLEASRELEPIDAETVNQWARLFESEAIKRGQDLTGGSHIFVPIVFGMNPDDRFRYKSGELQPTEEMKSRMAMLNGKRDVYHNDIFFTQFCMSRADLRQIYVDAVVDFAKANPHLKVIGCSLGDLPRNHCECEECRKLRPTDYYVMILNEIDRRLTEEGIDDVKLVLSTYVDQMFTPIQERIKNPDRFYMALCPIYRSYASSFTEDTAFPAPQEYVRNNWVSPRTMEELLANFKEWQKIFSGNSYIFEYHFYVHQYRDLGLMNMSRRLYEDVLALELLGMDGYQEDGSNKSFFPHGFHGIVYAETLVNKDLDYEALKQDYFAHAYGPDWKAALGYFEKLSQLIDHSYMCGDKQIDPTQSIYYDPERVKDFEQVHNLAAQGRALAAAHKQMPHRIQVMHWRMLDRHTEWCDLIADCMIAKCKGQDVLAQEMWKKAVDQFSKYDMELDKWFDMSLAAVSYNRIMKAKKPTADF